MKVLEKIKEQWKLRGLCFLCRKKNYCGMKCKKWINRQHLDIRGR